MHQGENGRGFDELFKELDVVVTPTERAGEEKLTAMQRHVRNGHTNDMSGCLATRNLSTAVGLQS